MKIFIWILYFVIAVPTLAATPQNVSIPGRLFYTPTQRANQR